ncbi:mucin-associated surface protein (MASP), putative [Trypanosoma cruzi]|nr:mucin-associated surface protein (MASP), putative [Trypanosoma cruzi]
MAMMMTGRVLLVCALCVLWCGVCGGERSETPPDSPDNPSDDQSLNEEEPVGVTPGGLKNGEQAAPKQTSSPTRSELPELPSSLSPAQPGGGASVTARAKMDNQDQNAEEGKKEVEKEKQDKDKEEGEEDDATEEEVEVTIISEEELKNASNEAPTETPGGPTNDAETQTATTQVNGESSPEALEGVKQSEEVQSEKDSNNSSQTKSVASIAANQHNETSADHGESGSPLPTANGDAANNNSDKSIEDGISNSDPAADGAGTAEGKQNENKEANPKKTPVTAAAMKTTTATTGDSDGSTAVSHTTSPLLLLLVVACAAA